MNSNDSEQRFESWWRNERPNEGAYLEAKALWRASGRWHRLRALREAEQWLREAAGHYEAGHAWPYNKPLPELGATAERIAAFLRGLAQEFGALIAAEEKQHGPS